jgi:hypothetical protein
MDQQLTGLRQSIKQGLDNLEKALAISERVV